MEKQKVLDRIKSSMMVLVGIGTEISEKHHTREELLAFYQEIAGAVKGKFYFVVTLNTDDLIYEAGFDPSLIVAPCGSDRTGNVITNGHYDESGYLPQWKAYQTWLGNTLNRELVILELGVGFEYPSVLRFPDEKMTFSIRNPHWSGSTVNFLRFRRRSGREAFPVTADPVDFWSK